MKSRFGVKLTKDQSFRLRACAYKLANVPQVYDKLIKIARAAEDRNKFA
jgi:hypothetical protein